MRTSDSVAALKNVLLPAEGFPTSPSNIFFSTRFACGSCRFWRRW